MANKYKAIAASVPTLIALSVTLFVAVLVLAALYVQERNLPDVQVVSSPTSSVGAYQYEFKDGKAIKVAHESVDKLAADLKKRSEKEARHGDNCPRPTYHVNVMNVDRTQALVKYGCDGPSAQMFAKYVDGEWDFISPTNKFNEFSVPLCEHVDENELSSEVAPVCYQVVEDKAVYTVR